MKAAPRDRRLLDAGGLTRVLGLAATVAVLAGCQSAPRGVSMHANGQPPVELTAESQQLPSGVIDYRIQPLDGLVIEVHRASNGPELADFGNSVQVDLSLRGTAYRIAPGDQLGLALQTDGERESVLIVRPDGHLTLPRIGVDVAVVGLELQGAARLVASKYASVMVKPQVALTLLKSSADQLARLAGTYDVSRDGRIVVPSLGGFDVRGKSSDDIAALIQTAAERVYRNHVVVSATISEYSLANSSVSVSSDARRYFRETAKVSVDGSIYFPVGGVFDASGKSLAELGAEVSERFKAKYANPVDVHVSFSEQGQLGVFVGGEVRAPGRAAFQPAMTVTQVLASVGWVNDAGDLSRVRLVHQTGPRQYTVYVTNVLDVVSGNGAGFQDLQVSPRDMIVVPRTGIAEANLAVDLYIRRMLPFGTSVSYTYVDGRRTTVP